jgi:pimeloyl-ACP methyl ester carboxylesterase
MAHVDSGGFDIHYEAEGSGPCLVLHGGAGGDLRTWRYAGYTEGLRGFRLILIDQRGHGRSGRPNLEEYHTIGQYAADVAAVLTDAGEETTGFWGYSAGFLVGLAFASAYPSRLKALVGTGAFSLTDLSDTPVLVDREAFIAEVIAQRGVVASYERFMEAESDRFPEPIDRNVRETDPRMGALRRLAWRNWHGPRSVIRHVSAPVLVILGEKEDPHHTTEKFVAALPDGNLVILPGHGHLSSFYRSDVTIPHAIPFLREHLP